MDPFNKSYQICSYRSSKNHLSSWICKCTNVDLCELCLYPMDYWCSTAKVHSSTTDHFAISLKISGCCMVFGRTSLYWRWNDEDTNFMLMKKRMREIEQDKKVEGKRNDVSLFQWTCGNFLAGKIWLKANFKLFWIWYGKPFLFSADIDWHWNNLS